MGNFQSGLDEVTFAAQPDALIVTNPVGDERETGAIFRPTDRMRTRLTLLAAEFNRYQVQEPGAVTFCLKELKAVLGFVEHAAEQITAHFSGAGRPMVLAMTTFGFEADFVLATLLDSEPVPTQNGTTTAEPTTATTAVPTPVPTPNRAAASTVTSQSQHYLQQQQQQQQQQQLRERRYLQEPVPPLLSASSQQSIRGTTMSSWSQQHPISQPPRPSVSSLSSSAMTTAHGSTSAAYINMPPSTPSAVAPATTAPVSGASYYGDGGAAATPMQGVTAGVTHQLSQDISTPTVATPSIMGGPNMRDREEGGGGEESGEEEEEFLDGTPPADDATTGKVFFMFPPNDTATVLAPDTDEEELAM